MGSFFETEQNRKALYNTGLHIKNFFQSLSLNQGKVLGE
jgi:hypothetical protein